MAEVALATAMVGKGHRTIGAAEHGAAFFADQIGGKTAAIEEEKRLPASCQVVADRFDQLRQEGGAFPAAGIQ